MQSSDSRKDLALATTIGLLVGLLIQPILVNVQAFTYVSAFLPASRLVLSAIIALFFMALAAAAISVARFLGRYLAVAYQLAKFAAVGTLNTLVDLGLFNYMLLISPVPVGEMSRLIYATLKTISFLAATTNSYFWNKFWTFGDKTRSESGKVVKFYLITGTNWLLNVGVALFVRSVAPPGVDPSLLGGVVAPICGVFAGMTSNFLGYKFLVFKETGPTAPASPQTPA